MSSFPTYKIIVTEYFKKQLKRLLKKNRLLLNEFKNILLNFDKQQSVSIGMGVYKLRMKSQFKGKSGGYRLYIFVMETDGILAPICIYSKNEKDNLSYDELSWHLEKIKEELKQLL